MVAAARRSERIAPVQTESGPCPARSQRFSIVTGYEDGVVVQSAP